MTPKIKKEETILEKVHESCMQNKHTVWVIKMLLQWIRCTLEYAAGTKELTKP